MSLGKIQNVFESFVWGTGIKFTISKKTEISERYTAELPKNYTGVQDYDGSVVGIL